MKVPTYDWHGPVLNEAGPMLTPRFFVVHIMQGTLEGTDAWFHNPAAQVSAHLGHGKAGERWQWVDTNRVAWAEATYNTVSWSAEHEGVTGDELTDPQLESLAFAIAQWSRETGQPIVRCSSPAGFGVIGHSELGVAGGNHPDCPGAPVLAQLPAVILRARQIAGAIAQEVDSMHVLGKNDSADGKVHIYAVGAGGNLPSGHLVDWIPPQDGVPADQVLDMTDRVAGANNGWTPLVSP